MPAKRATNRKKKPSRKKSGQGAAGGDSSALRLQRVLASAGYGSRRQCEELIEAGRVEVDGQIVTRLGTTVDPELAKVRVDGDLLKPRKLIYYAVNKPVGVVTTNRDPQGRPRVIDLVPPVERVFPVGRLDRNSEGLILLTNDGELAQKLTHPKFGVRKVYRVTVAGKVDVETMKQMRQGIYLAEGHVRVEGAKLLKSRSRSTEMEIILREGKNREIRRILARLGHKVQHLRRIAVGPLRLGDLPSGAYRVVRRTEIDKLWLATETAAADGERGGKKKRKTAKRGAKKKTAKQETGRQQSSKQQSGKRGRSASSSGPPTNRSNRVASKSTKRRSSEFPAVDELTSNATIGSVIGGETEEHTATETRPRRRKAGKAAPRRGTKRKAVKGRRSRSQADSSTSSRSNTKRKSAKKHSPRGSSSGPKKRGRRKRN